MSADAGEISITVDSLVHRYRESLALDHVSLSIPNGATVAFIGGQSIQPAEEVDILNDGKRWIQIPTETLRQVRDPW